jgi:DNA-binding transcriptional regulator WhiA
MSQADRDLVAALRAEIAGVDPARPCDRAAESAGLAGALAGRRGTVGRLLVRLRRAASTAASSASSTAAQPAPFEWSDAPEHCRTAWLRGRFLARGSLSISGGRTHLEFVVEADEAPILAARLGEAGLPAAWRIRRGRGVVTWKSADIVGTFLRRIGAGAALLELEARQVSRALRGELNRVLNAESANVQRVVAAAERQLAAIDHLTTDGRLAEQSYVVRSVAEGRRETPEATLGELADRLALHRSAVQRALERIEWLDLHGDEERPPERRRRRGAPLA